MQSLTCVICKLIRNNINHTTLHTHRGSSMLQIQFLSYILLGKIFKNIISRKKNKDLSVFLKRHLFYFPNF